MTDRRAVLALASALLATPCFPAPPEETWSARCASCHDEPADT